VSAHNRMPGMTGCIGSEPCRRLPGDGREVRCSDGHRTNDVAVPRAARLEVGRSQSSFPLAGRKGIGARWQRRKWPNERLADATVRHARARPPADLRHEVGEVLLGSELMALSQVAAAGAP
jgi:hypothetical protein